MRNRFERQLLELNNELIQMGSMIEHAIEMGISALVRQDVEKAKKAIAYDEEIDGQEKTVESLCMKLLLQQQPVAKDLRLISAAVKDDYRYGAVGDHAADISEMTILMSDATTSAARSTLIWWKVWRKRLLIWSSSAWTHSSTRIWSWRAR